MAAPLGSLPKAVPVFLIILYHKYLGIFLIYSTYIYTYIYIYVLNTFHIFSFVWFVIYSVNSGSGHDRSQTFSSISHVSGPKLTFWRNFTTVLHGFASRSEKCFCSKRRYMYITKQIWIHKVFKNIQQILEILHGAFLRAYHPNLSNSLMLVIAVHRHHAFGVQTPYETIECWVVVCV